ncbi:hypothetical protein GCM10023322_34370 [Rugosimonospora acidiphila]|uniref:DUF4331 domain-containing protein n=1 Tax=Rugosimonospora acidiphila TaxID=556531 RepID=A0ABP9RUD5_9ACTN
MSHHLDTPLAAQNGQLYIDDLYVFNGDRGTVFIMDVNSSVTGDDIQHGFHPEARYEFRVHLDGAALEELTYRVAFSPPDVEGQQAFSLYALVGSEARADDAAGTLLVEGRTGDLASNNGVRIWAGRVADPFYVDLDQLAVIDAALSNGAKVDASKWRPENAKNSFAGKTVQSIVIEVAEQDEPLTPGTHLGVWCTTKLATDAGGWRTINRAGHPMMWPIFWPKDTDFSDPANARHPSDDLSAEGDGFASLIARVVAANGTSGDPEGHGRAVVGRIFPDVLPFEVGSAAGYGFAVHNGRTLSDNVAEAMFSLVLNAGVTTGLTAVVTAQARDTKFPYVVPA